ncbi:MAG TPA: hypothetical protein VHY20_07895, partial [Pirellulales bacterium]|nr:hypothetical protein [Pirellulales bacterium]
MSVRSICGICGVLIVLGVTVSAAEKSQPATDDASAWKQLYSEDFLSSPSPDWHVGKGTWKVVDGAWQGSEEAADKHAAAARHDMK